MGNTCCRSSAKSPSAKNPTEKPPSGEAAEQGGHTHDASGPKKYLPGTYKVKASNLVVRKSIERGVGDIEMSIPKGCCVEVEEVEGDRGRTSRGWVSMRCLEPVAGCDKQLLMSDALCGEVDGEAKEGGDEEDEEDADDGEVKVEYKGNHVVFSLKGTAVSLPPDKLQTTIVTQQGDCYVVQINLTESPSILWCVHQPVGKVETTFAELHQKHHSFDLPDVASPESYTALFNTALGDPSLCREAAFLELLGGPLVKDIPLSLSASTRYNTTHHRTATICDEDEGDDELSATARTEDEPSTPYKDVVTVEREGQMVSFTWNGTCFVMSPCQLSVTAVDRFYCLHHRDNPHLRIALRVSLLDFPTVAWCIHKRYTDIRRAFQAVDIHLPSELQDNTICIDDAFARAIDHPPLRDPFLHLLGGPIWVPDAPQPLPPRQRSLDNLASPSLPATDDTTTMDPLSSQAQVL